MVPTAAEIDAARARVQILEQTLAEVLFGQELLIRQVLIGMLSQGHLLLEGLPGLGKTQLVKGLAKALGLEDKRIQFTPDLLPGDVTGNPILEDRGGERRFVFRRGPIFAHLVLADEINRASPKTQSALLEAMQERQVTVLGDTHELPRPFFVLATQNPIELEGTYPLPEAQLDRFLFKLEVKATSVEVLQTIIRRRDLATEPEVKRTMDRDELLGLIQLVKRIHLPDVVVGYIARLVDATQPGRSQAASALRFGASPRAALALAAGARARALLEGRPHAAFEDVAVLARAVLAHRLIPNYGARLEGITSDTVVTRLLEEVPDRDRRLPNTLVERS